MRLALVLLCFASILPAQWRDGGMAQMSTAYTASGSLLSLAGHSFSVNSGTLTNGRGCAYVTGTGIVCDSVYLTAETDPQVGTLTASAFCTTDGTDIDCTATNVAETDQTENITGTWSFGDLTKGYSQLGGSLTFLDAVTLRNGVLSPPAFLGNYTWGLPQGSGTIPVTASSPLAISAAGDISCATCVTGETDPQVGTLSATKWCAANAPGVAIECDQDVPVLTTEASEYAAALRASILNRHYDAVVTVSTTITAALAAIADNSSAKRYLLIVPDGTYAEEIQAKDYVDIVGESRTGTILTSTSQVSDTIMGGGINFMLSTMTVRHTTNIGETQKYPIHMDTIGTTATPNRSSVTVIYNCTVEALGTDAKSGIGIGLWGNQRVYLADSTFSSTQDNGIFAHNSAAQSLPAQLTILNCDGTGGTWYGFGWQNIGSTQADVLALIGGAFSGTAADIYYEDSGGAGEAYLLTVGTTGTVTTDHAEMHYTHLFPLTLPRDGTLMQPEYGRSPLYVTNGYPDWYTLASSTGGQIGYWKYISTAGSSYTPITTVFTLALDAANKARLSSASNYLSLYSNGNLAVWLKNPIEFSYPIYVSGSLSPLSFEGAVADAYETTLAITEPSGADRVATLPNESGIIQLNGTAAIAADDATPSMIGARIWTTAANTVATAITDLDDPTVGQIYIIICGSTTNASTISDAGNFALSAAWNPDSVGDNISLFVAADNSYYEISRSDN